METSSVYSSRYTSNPSVTGDHVKDEISEVTKWANQHLTMGGYSDSLVTDLPSDIADGITLIRLVHAVSGEFLPKHFSNPMMRVQKLENLQLCMKFLKEKNVQLTGVHAEDIATGNIKAVLAVCNCIKRRFTGSGPSPRTGGSHKSQNRLSFSSLDKDDIPILSWTERMVHRDVPDYAALYDGTVLCDLVNELHHGAISQQNISSASSSEERLQLAFNTAQKHLFIFPTSIVVSQITSGSEDAKLRSYLQQCKQLHDRQSHRKGLMTTLSQPPRSNKTRKSREEAFESLRSTSGGSRPTREEDKIASRTYEGIQDRMNRENKPMHSSTGHLATKPHPHSSKKPMTDIYVSGASSFTDLSSTRNDHVVMTTRQTHINKHSSSSENLKSKKKGRFGRHHSMEPLLANSGLGKSWPRSSSYDSDDAGSLSHYHSQGDIQGFPDGTGLYREGSVASSMESIDVPLRSQSSGVGQRAPSYSRLNSGSTSEDGPTGQRLGGLEERMGLLATQFLYERRDMFKQIHGALVKERKKRQAAEQRLKELEKLSKQMMQMYNSRFLELAKEVSVLRGELTSVGRGNEPAHTVTMEIKQLKQQVAELSDKRSHMTSHMTATRELGPVSPGAGQGTAKHSLFLKKRASSDVSGSVHYPGPYLKGSAVSFKKLSNFFGEAPPRLMNLSGFMEELKYTHLLPVFVAHDITLPELQCLNEANLEQLGIPLGARIRILSELKKLEPLDENDTVI